MSLSKHSLANFAGAIVPMLVALVTIPFYLQHIGAERYGVLAVIMALLGYSGFLDLGLGRAVTQRMARMADADAADRSSLLWTALTLSFVMGLVGGGVLWFAADYILNKQIEMSEEHRAEATSAVIWLSVFLPLLLPSSVLSGALQARLRFIEISSIQLISGTLGQVIPLAIAIGGILELNYLVPATLAMRLLGILLLLWQCIKHAPLLGIPQINKAHLKPMLRYGGWVSVVSMISPMLVTIDRLVIASVSGAKSVAQYTVPYDLVSRSMIIQGSVYNALFPRLAAANKTDAVNVAKETALTLNALMTPIVIIGIFLAHPFMEAWVGNDFASKSIGVAEIIFIGIWLNSLAIPFHARFMANENPKKIVIIYLIEIPIYLAMLFYLLNTYGVVGAAIAWSLRVALDSTILLSVNSALKDISISTYLPFILIISSTLLALMNDSWYTKALACLALITVSAAKDREILNSAFQKTYENIIFYFKKNNL